MTCHDTMQQIEPPAWHAPNPSDGSDSIIVGFVTYGSPDRASKLGDLAEKSGLNCHLSTDKNGRSEIAVIFNKTTNSDAALSLFQKVRKGEFGTTDTGLILVRASALPKK